jgi:PHD/YefM family antitoxin component YafN of YafNO toxin-antitoxin module
MFTVEAGTTIATISELRTQTRQTLAASQERPVVVLVDGQPAGAMISMADYQRLEEYRENEQLARLAARRLESVRAGQDTLMEHDDFWAAVDARKASTGGES